MKFIVLLIISVLGMSIHAQDSHFTEIYKSNKGKIVFSKERIKIGSFDEVNLSKEFSLNDPIYAHIFLTQSLAYFYNQHDVKYTFDKEHNKFNYGIRALIDDTVRATWYYEMPKEDFKYKINFPLVLTTNKRVAQEMYSEEINQWARIITQLQEGNHKVQLEVIMIYHDMVGDEYPVLAKGNFSLKVDKQFINNYLNEFTTGLPPATLYDSVLERKIKDASKNNIPYAIPLKSIITDKNVEWHNLIDENGFVFMRYIIASTVYEFVEDGTCWVKTARYSQKHEGNGKFAPIVYSFEEYGYYDYMIPCFKVK